MVEKLTKVTKHFKFTKAIVDDEFERLDKKNCKEADLFQFLLNTTIQELQSHMCDFDQRQCNQNEDQLVPTNIQTVCVFLKVCTCAFLVLYSLRTTTWTMLNTWCTSIFFLGD